MLEKINDWLIDYAVTVVSIIAMLWFLCMALLTVAALFKYVFF